MRCMRDDVRVLLFWLTMGFIAYAIGYYLVQEVLLPLPIESLVLFVL